jgi:hypothetical protein
MYLGYLDHLCFLSLFVAAAMILHAEKWRGIEFANSGPPPPRSAEESRAGSVSVDRADNMIRALSGDAAACSAFEEICTDVCKWSAGRAEYMVTRRWSGARRDEDDATARTG